jgi:arylsulfatase A-like enzyme
LFLREINKILRSRYFEYFTWLVFLLEISVLQAVIRNLHIFGEFHIPLMECIASYFLYVDMSIPLVFPILIVFVIFEIIWKKTGHCNQHQILSTAIIIFTAVVLTILFCFIIFSTITILWENRTQIRIVGDMMIWFREVLLKVFHMNNKLIAFRDLIFNKIPITGIALLLISSPISIKLYRKHKGGILLWYKETTTRIKFFVILSLFGGSISIPWLFIHAHHSTKANICNLGKQQSHYPNLFIIVIDDLTAEDMSLYGYSLPTTPNLERETENWLVFSNAYSVSNSTLPFFPSVLTGRYPYIYKWNQYGKLTASDKNWIDLPAITKTLGYKIYWNGCYPPKLYGLNQSIDDFGLKNTYLSLFYKISYASFFPIPYVFDFHFKSPTDDDFGQATAVQLSQAISFLTKNKHGDKPIFSYLHVAGVHGFPYSSGEDFGLFLSKQQRAENDGKKYLGSYVPEKQKEVDNLRLRYDEAIVHVDKLICRFIDTLKQLDLYNNSMIVITADHGENFASGFSSHSTPLLSYAEQHVPLLIKYPFQETAGKRTQLVSVIDIVPTILEYLKVKIASNAFDGHSVKLPIQEKDSKRIVYSLIHYDRGNWSNSRPTNAAICGNYKIISRQGKLFLFDIVKDPAESNNLYGSLKIPQIEHALEIFMQRKKEIEKGIPVDNAQPLIDKVDNMKIER